MKRTVRDNRIVKAVCLCLSMALTAFFLSGCMQQKDDGFKYVIGVSQPDVTEAWRITMNDEIRRQASQYGDVKVIFYDAGQDTDKQMQDLRDMVAQRVNAIIISMNDTKSLSGEIKSIRSKGIPVIVVGYPPDNSDYDMHIYCDNLKLGKMAGEYAARLLGPAGGNILEVLGDPDSRMAQERKLGFREGIASNPAIRVEYVIVGYWLRDEVEERAPEIFGKKPPVDLVFAQNDAMAVGAWKVAGKMKQSPKYIGIGGISPDVNGLEEVKDNVLSATFLYPTGGKEAVEYALKLLKDEKVPKEYELQPVEITKQNVDSYINDFMSSNIK